MQKYTKCLSWPFLPTSTPLSSLLTPWWSKLRWNGHSHTSAFVISISPLQYFRLVSFIAPRLNKPIGRFNWVLETDKLMSKVTLSLLVAKATQALSYWVSQPHIQLDTSLMKSSEIIIIHLKKNLARIIFPQLKAFRPFYFVKFKLKTVGRSQQWWQAFRMAQNRGDFKLWRSGKCEDLDTITLQFLGNWT